MLNFVALIQKYSKRQKNHQRLLCEVLKYWLASVNVGVCERFVYKIILDNFEFLVYNIIAIMIFSFDARGVGRV